MTIAYFAKGAVAALVFFAASPPLSQEDDNECGGILASLSKAG